MQKKLQLILEHSRRAGAAALGKGNGNRTRKDMTKQATSAFVLSSNKNDVLSEKEKSANSECGESFNTISSNNNAVVVRVKEKST